MKQVGFLFFSTIVFVLTYFTDCSVMMEPGPVVSDNNDEQDMFSARLTESVGRNVSDMIRSFLHENPMPTEPDLDEYGEQIAGMPIIDIDDASSYEPGPSDDDHRGGRYRRYILRDPGNFERTLNEIKSAGSWQVLATKLTTLANHFWYGEWCGAGWSKINSSNAQCCHCRDGRNTAHVDIQLIRNTAGDCVKCGAHPIDPVDSGCMLHDICYTCSHSPFDWIMAHCECERIISKAVKIADCTQSISRLYPDMDESLRFRWCNFYKTAIPILFENKPCYCPKNGQPFVAFNLNFCDRGHLLIPVKDQ